MKLVRLVLIDYGNIYCVDQTKANILLQEPCFKSYELFSHGSVLECLRYEIDPLPYLDALWNCRSDGGDLMKIDSQTKNDFFKAFISIHGAPNADVWIQRKLLPSTCTWVFEDNTTNSYTSWGTGGPKCEPAQNRMRAKATSGYNWYDRYQGELYTYLCEMDPAV
ncbi:macrophage mannose receptor 1-like [Ostrea edulis]|uniref:macrophage mannose receptor 1-like n=1 Tax=Ostrea edulis TaxID=37623 RepID=UPI0024AEE3E5|nr:macrophage mannose receptor 1-like [Ostrea edulis]